MRTRVKLFAGLFVAALALGIPTFLMIPVPEGGRVVTDKPVEAYLAEDGKLDSLYQTWKAGYERSGGNRNYRIALGWSKGLSIGHTYASGVARIDMIGGTARVELDNLGPSEDGWDVWLVDNVEGPQRSALPEPGDLMHRLGRLHKTGSKALLEARFDGSLFAAFDVDVVAVTPRAFAPTRAPSSTAPRSSSSASTPGRARNRHGPGPRRASPPSSAPGSPSPTPPSTARTP